MCWFLQRYLFGQVRDAFGGFLERFESTEPTASLASRILFDFEFVAKLIDSRAQLANGRCELDEHGFHVPVQATTDCEIFLEQTSQLVNLHNLRLVFSQ